MKDVFYFILSLAAAFAIVLLCPLFAVALIIWWIIWIGKEVSKYDGL
ncbi:hypothetical protein AAE250_02400 [Bacteroides sp. GD17]|jgi:hypothetical protein